jgi:mono/diheme cytochrome c family protein
MNSTLLTTIHVVVVQLFLLIYVVKTVLLFANREALLKFTRGTRLLEMIVSTLFLVTGIWLFVILGAIKTMQIIKLVLVFASIPIAVIGYKKMNKAMALISFLFIVGAYGLAEAGRSKPYIPNKVIVEGNADERTKLGATIYIANCAMCHGQDGKKMYREAADLSISASSTVRMDTLIRHGSRGKMPAFEGCLTDEQIAAAEDYIITLRQPSTVQ